MEKIIILLVILGTNCKAQQIQKNTEMKTFDIETFKKNKVNNEYTFVNEKDEKIRQIEWENQYEEIIKPKNSYFEEYKSYFKNGNLKMVVERFPNKFLKSLKQYDKTGNIVEETNYDNGFDHTWADLLKYLEKRKVDIKGRYTTINKENGNWRFSYVEGIYIYDVIVDGKTGKVLQDAKNVFEEGS